MTQADRDRLVTLKKAKKKLITQGEAAEELGVSTRQVKRLLQALKKRGDKAVIHGLRGKPSSRRIPEAKEKEAVKTLSAEVYQDFGPTPGAREEGDIFTLPERRHFYFALTKPVYKLDILPACVYYPGSLIRFKMAQGRNWRRRKGSTPGWPVCSECEFEDSRWRRPR